MFLLFELSVKDHSSHVHIYHIWLLIAFPSTIQISVNKCRVLALNDGKNDKYCVFHLSGSEILSAPVVPNSENFVVSKLSFGQHLLYIVWKLSHFVNFNFKSFIMLDTVLLIALYKCYVLLYSIIVVSSRCSPLTSKNN